MVAAAAAAAVLPAASAPGANVAVGSPLTAAFAPTLTGGGAGAVTFANTSLPYPGTNVTSPVNGTVVTWRITGASGGPFSLRVLRPAGGGTYTGAGTSAPGTPLNPGLQAFATNLPIQAGDLVGIDDTAPTDRIGTANTGATFDPWIPRLADGETRSPFAAAAPREIGFNAEVRPVSNDISFGKVTRNKNRGTARLVVSVPDPGQLVLFGKGLKKLTANATAPGDLTLKIRTKGKAKQELNEDGKEKVGAKVMFSPTGIAPATEGKKLILRKRL